MKVLEALRKIVVLGVLVLAAFVLAQAAEPTGMQDGDNTPAEARPGDAAGGPDDTIHFGW